MQSKNPTRSLSVAAAAFMAPLIPGVASADVVVDFTKLTTSVTVQGGGGASPVTGGDSDAAITYGGAASVSAIADTGIQDATDGLGDFRGTGQGNGTATATAGFSGTTLSGAGSVLGHFEATPDLGNGQSLDNSQFAVYFRVTGSPVDYDFVANLSDDYESPDQVQLRRMDFGPAGVPVVICNDITPNVNTSGTLDPGEYKLFGSVGAAVSGGAAQSPGDETASYDYSLTFQAGTTLSFNTDPGTPYCFGDGSGTACPCASGDLGAGCPNTTTGGAVLQAFGSPEMADDSLALMVTGVPPFKAGLCVKGSVALNGGMGNLVGDGLLCTAPQRRSQVLVSDSIGCVAMTNWRGQAFSDYPSVANAGVPTYYQWWYRDPQNPCTGVGFNFSNGLQVDWQ